MASEKIYLGVLFGGKSAEHEISLRSAKNVIEAIDQEKFEPVLIGIAKSGKWHYTSDDELIKGTQDSLSLDTSHREVILVPQGRGRLIFADNGEQAAKLDVVFPILHGPMGEDGTMQGLLKLADIPFVGCDVLGSAAGMDKDVMKRLLLEAQIPIGKYLVAKAHEKRPSFENVKAELGLPCFIKPANMGSSVGVSRASNQAEYKKAMDEAFLYDRKVVIEEAIEGKEIECAILGNEFPKASVLGEVSFNHNFYSYEAKYLDDKGYQIDIPAKIDDSLVEMIQQIAIDTFQVLECEGFSRVDVFLTPDHKVLVNEINTIPGFTKISMYPKLWEASGLSYTDLITNLIELSMDRYHQLCSLKTSII